MAKKNRHRITALVMALMIGFSIIFPANMALAATPTSLNADVSVTGIPSGGTIDSSKEIKVTVDFDVPVIGDGVENYYQHGDTVTLLLSESFQFDPLPTSPIVLEYKTGSETKKLGTVTLINNNQNQATATILFDGDNDIFDPGDEGLAYSNVSGTFQASLKYNGTHDTDGSGNNTVAILDKTYQLQLPAIKLHMGW